MELGDTEDGLEMLVEDVEQAITKAPKEEERYDEANGEDQSSSSEKARRKRRRTDRNSTTGHF